METHSVGEQELAVLRFVDEHAPVTAREVVEKYGDRIMEHPVGTGPFLLKDWRRASEITLVRNPDYKWAPEAYFKRNGPPNLDQINWRIIEEPATRVATLQSGESDMVEEVAPATRQDQRSRTIGPDDIHHMGGEDQGAVRPLFKQLLVRPALEALIAGRDDLVD